MKELEEIKKSKEKYEYLADIAIQDQPCYIMEDEVIERLYSSDLKEKLSDALNTLDDREREMIKLYYIDGGHTYASIGAIYGVSGPRAEQIIKRALRKLRSGNNKKNLMPFIEAPTKDLKDIIEEEIVSVIKKLYVLRKMNLSDEAKAIFCSTIHITLSVEDVNYLSTLIDAILINNRLDEYHFYPLYSLVYFFSEHFKKYDYPFPTIFKTVSNLADKDEEEKAKGIIREHYALSKLFNYEDK